MITRDRNKAVDVWNMADAGKWYILETNYDHWKSPLFIDDRRTPANRCMQNMTQNVSRKYYIHGIKNLKILSQMIICAKIKKKILNF